jgi:hypothetical protein
LTLTAVVEVDVAVDVEPIVDRHFDHRKSTYEIEPTSAFAVQVERLATAPRPQRLRRAIPAFYRHFFSGR